MLFSSITFLFYFLPIVLFTYWIIPKRFRNMLLFISSLFFYAWGEPKYVLLMLFMIGIGYGIGLLLEKTSDSKWHKPIIVLGVLLGIGILAIFKYTDFFVDTWNQIFQTSIPLPNIVLPIGISFYTFQMISYVLDVSRGDAKTQKNPLKLATYIAMFPQLIAGPIVRYTDIEKQLDRRTCDWEKLSMGTRRFVLGLGKKVILANTFGELVTTFHETTEKTVLYVWIYAIAASLQIYFDFSGYSDMAIGLGHLFGFQFPENFDYPYEAKSITEFWRRWHMTLGSWFRDYLYIPLGGNRVKKWRWFLNIFIVWMATGLWHGASFNFVLWGIYFAILLIIEKKWILKWLQKRKIINHIYLIFMVVVSFILFDSATIQEAIQNIAMLLGGMSVPVKSMESLFLLKDYGWLFVIGVLGATSMPAKLVRVFKVKCGSVPLFAFLEPVYLGIILMISVASLINGSFNPFLYFRF